MSDVVEKVVTEKALPPNHYALYLVLGDSESHRVLSFTERLLAVLCSTGSDCFLCLKLNAFGETLKQYVSVCERTHACTVLYIVFLLDGCVFKHLCLLCVD